MQKIDLSKMRIIDLTKTITPPKKRPVTQKEISALALRDELIYPFERRPSELDDTTYFLVTLMSHLGTHVEAPNHYKPDWKKLVDFPLETWMGRMVLFDLHLEPQAPITYEVLEKADNGRVKENDIVLLTTGYKEQSKFPLLSLEMAEFLVSKKVKLFGFDDSVWIVEPAREMALKLHHVLFKNNIPMLEHLCNLDSLQQDVSFLLALPALKVKGIDASPVRAIVIEGIGPT